MNKLTFRYFPTLSYAGSEAINTLCTNLSFAGENVKKIMITSCHASEGKSFLSMNVLRRMAQYQKRVAIVDADLRRSNLISRHGIQMNNASNENWGLSHYLAGMASEEDVVYATNIAGAYMVPIGRTVSNPLPLLNSPRLGRLLEYLARNMDYVFVDAPPVGTVIDAAQIAKFCDGTLLIVNYNAVRRQELIDTKEQLEQTGCPILGTVLNEVELDNYLSKKYYYKSYYSRYDYYGKSSDQEKRSGRNSTRTNK